MSSQNYPSHIKMEVANKKKVKGEDNTNILKGNILSFDY